MQFVTRLYQRVAHRRDERGAIMIMAVLGLAVMVISASLSIDIGRIALEKRKDQSVADLAALDAARDRNNSLALAQASATRNGFDWHAAGNSIGVEIGSLDSHGAFVPNVGSTSVRATVTSTVKYLFQVGSRTVTAKAVAAMRDFGKFGVGSNLASFSTDQSTLMNAVIGQMMGAVGGNAGVTLVGWQGLTTSTFTLAALQQQLINGGLDVGTLDKLMTTNVTLVQLYSAMANVMTNQGNLAQASVLSGMATVAGGAPHLTLGQLFSIDGADGTALSTAWNVFDLVTGAAEVANGSNFVTIPNAGVTVPGVTNTTLSLKVIEGMKFKDGPVGTTVTTSQVQLTVTPTLNMSLSIPPLVNPTVTGDLPFTVQAGAATGTLEAVTCTNPQSMQVGVDPQPVNLSSSGTLHLSSKVLLAQVPLLDMGVTANQVIAGSHGDLTFTPPTGTQHYGSTTVGLSGMPYTTGSVTVLGALPLPQLTLTNAVVSALGPQLGQIDTKVVSPLFQALGLQVGSADVKAVGITCNVLGLVG